MRISDTKKDNTNVPNIPIDVILDGSNLCFSIKNNKLEYIHTNKSFGILFDLKNLPKSDFDLFLPEIAYECGHDDNLVFTSLVSSENERVLISKSGAQVVANISRSTVKYNGETYLLSIVQDITQAKQEKQFGAYKQVLTEPEVFEKILNRFSNLIFTSETREEVFKRVGALCLDILDLKDLSIFKADNKNNLLRQVVYVERGTDIKYDESGEKFFKISMDKGIVGKCATELKTIIVEDTSIHPDYVADKLQNRSEISVPIIYEQKLLGVLDSESSLLNKYNDKIRRTLEGIASLLAIKLNELSNLEVLEANNTKLTSLIKGNPAAIAMLDTDFKYIEVSERWIRDFTRNNSNELIGKNHFKLNPRIPMRWKNGIEKALKGHSKQINKEAYRHPNGETSYFTGKVSPWYTTNNRIGGVIIMAENVTNAVKNDLKLSQTSIELKEVRKFGQLFNWEFKLDSGSIRWYQINDDTKNKPIIHRFDEIFDFIDPVFHAEIKSSLKKAIEQSGSFSFIHTFEYQDEKF